MRGRLDAELSFTCQRCLEAVSCPVHADVMLLLRRPGETARSADGADESDEALEVPGPLSLAALVEDELILALPMFARHAPGTCRTAAVAEDDAGGGRPHPFAGLRQLKRGKKDQR
jgi:uncharacterized protein